MSDVEGNFQRNLGAAGHFIFSAGHPRKTLFTIVGPRGPRTWLVVLEDQESSLPLIGTFTLSTNEKLCRAVELERRAVPA